MFTLQNLVQPETIDEAYKILMEKRSNTILGGCAFLRMGTKVISTGIDLSKLNLDFIREAGGEIEIGAMTSLREIETNPLLVQNFNGVLPKAVGNIVGVQFRNVATAGASVFSKYGFSDLITALLVLEADVELYGSGRVSLAEFMYMPVKKDILTKIIIKKDNRKAAYANLRNSHSDFLLINTAVSRLGDKWTVAVGARPGRAKIAGKASEMLSKKDLTQKDIEKAAELAAGELNFGTNMRASGEYRKAMCKVLIKRAVMEVV